MTHPLTIPLSIHFFWSFDRLIPVLLSLTLHFIITLVNMVDHLLFKCTSSTPKAQDMQKRLNLNLQSSLQLLLFPSIFMAPIG
jgi:hypothetical protein